LIRAYSQDTITLKLWQSYDAWGEPTWLIPDPIEVYIDWKTHMIRNIEGEQVVSRGMFYIIYDTKLTHKDRVIISNVEYVILDVRPGKDFSENHQEIHLQ